MCIPKYQKTRITCVCGNVIETFSTKGDFSVEVCAACQPFFTEGEVAGLAGRVDNSTRIETAARSAELKAREEARAVAEAAKKAKRKAAAKEAAAAKEPAKPTATEDLQELVVLSYLFRPAPSLEGRVFLFPPNLIGTLPMVPRREPKATP
jgi:large subunit ribosomal protein L31